MAISRQLKIQVFCDQMVAKVGEAAQGARRPPYQRLSSVLKACGYERRSAPGLRQIQETLEERGVLPVPALTTTGLQLEEVVYFAGHASMVSAGRRLSFHRMALCGTSSRRTSGGCPLSNISGSSTSIRCPLAGASTSSARTRRQATRWSSNWRRRAGDTLDQILKYMSELDPGSTGEPQVSGIIVSGRDYTVQRKELPDRIGRFPLKWLTYRVDLHIESCE